MDVNMINVITLAYMGDAVYEVYIREDLIKKGIAKVEDLQKEAIKYVSAKSQARILKYLLDIGYLSNEEIDVVKRGRNYKRGSHPKNTDIITYKNSTGFEALIGYLYLSDKIDRVTEIVNFILEEYDEEMV
ncbi:MAG: ribonuclease III domain-containing protein [Mycoplasmatota bacterium]|nr:ribonuclease III domain-containing protein [Mycoplasmatota bacterium]